MLIEPDYIRISWVKVYEGEFLEKTEKRSNRAPDGARTRDLSCRRGIRRQLDLTKVALYLLSYWGIFLFK